MPKLAHKERDKEQQRYALAIAAALLVLERHAQQTLRGILRTAVLHTVRIGATPEQVGASMRAVGRSGILRIRSAG